MSADRRKEIIMAENTQLQQESLPQPTDKGCTAESADTTPPAAADITIPVKFNKEIINLSVEDAKSFAQKGMKFDALAPELARLRSMASTQGQSVSEFLSALERQHSEQRKEELLSECGGNEALATRIAELEGAHADRDPAIDEVQKLFPSIKQLSDLPQTVVCRAHELGTDLLNEYLRYREAQRRVNRDTENAAKRANDASIGSLSNNGGGIDAVNAEFIKGLWSR